MGLGVVTLDPFKSVSENLNKFQLDPDLIQSLLIKFTWKVLHVCFSLFKICTIILVSVLKRFGLQ